MTHGSIAGNARRDKEAHPEHYCPWTRCLWYTGGGFCLRHTPVGAVEDEVDSPIEGEYLHRSQ